MSYACGENHPQYKHGMNETPEYYAYQSMIQRCCNPKTKPFKNYGGRGISVCARWLESFENFYADMGDRPSPDHSIDRYPDNDGNYEPGNCRWATRKEQTNNRRSNRIVVYRGVKMSLAEAVRGSKGGITRSIAKYRLRHGWSVDATMDTPRTR